VRWLLIAQRSSKRSGFTLLELLVALLIGSIIVSALLYGLVEILQTNQRESSRAETQREMQLAIDYISSDIRESVFVYDGDCLSPTTSRAGICRGLPPVLPTAISGAGKVPVLAMWRVDELPQVLIDSCRANAARINDNPPPAAINGVPCLSRRNYTLVVYYLDTTNPTGKWQGQARIRRYELPQFDQRGNRNTGWVDPTSTQNNFLGWPYALVRSSLTNLQTTSPLPDGTQNLAQGAPENREGAALVDFVDAPTGSQAVNTANACPGPATPPANPRQPPFVVSPTSGSTSFYACVRGGGVNAVGNANNEGGRNQEIYVFLRGNAAGRPGIPTNAENAKFEMETRVLTRGSYEKTPAE
jgi:prepilin-type N-terminal cleavage/methylation domain-containing protein